MSKANECAVIISVTFEQFCKRSAYAIESDPRIKESVTDPTTHAIPDWVTPICLLAMVDNTCVGGVMVLDGELCCLWSQRSGVGAFLVRHALNEGAYHLNCFDCGLVEYYQRLGFEEYAREANWTAGEPDVVFMRHKAVWPL